MSYLARGALVSGSVSFWHVPSFFDHFLAFWHSKMLWAYLVLSLPLKEALVPFTGKWTVFQAPLCSLLCIFQTNIFSVLLHPSFLPHTVFTSPVCLSLPYSCLHTSHPVSVCMFGSTNSVKQAVTWQHPGSEKGWLLQADVLGNPLAMPGERWLQDFWQCSCNELNLWICVGHSQAQVRIRTHGWLTILHWEDNRVLVWP